MLKKAKKILRDFFGFTGTYKTYKEKKDNSDPEAKPYVRPKRRSNNLIDGFTDTKWIKKVNDKSWKTRCKKKHQYDKHQLSEKEKELLGLNKEE